MTEMSKNECDVESIIQILHRFDVPKERIQEQRRDLQKYDLDVIGDSGFTALMTEVIRENEHAVAMLLENGAGTEIETSRGETALMLAIETGRVRIVDDISDFCDINYINKNGDNALAYAKYYGYQEIVDLLIRKGGVDTGKATYMEEVENEAFGK